MTGHTLLPAWSLAVREIVRFYRQRSRIIGTLATPLVFWIFLGSGLGAAFPAPQTPGGQGYLEYFFPGNLILSLLFTSIFSTISIIEDRREGFLQGVLVAPVSRSGVVLGKVLGGMLIAVFQGLLFLCLAPLAGFSLTLDVVGLAALSMVVTSFTLTCLGFFFAWWFNSSQGFHSVMNLVLFPMWLLCGAFFPVAKAPVWLQPVMYLNPLSYGMASLRNALYSGTSTEVTLLPYEPALAVTALFGVVFYCFAVFVVGHRPKEVFS